jgi:hypothetical protein
VRLTNRYDANSPTSAFASFRSRVSKTGTVTGILQRQQRADRIKGAYVFINERGMSVASPSAGWPNGEPPCLSPYNARSIGTLHDGDATRQQVLLPKARCTFSLYSNRWLAIFWVRDFLRVQSFCASQSP